MKGELHPTLETFVRRTSRLVRAFLHVDNRFERSCLYSGVATSRDSNGDTMTDSTIASPKTSNFV